MVWCCWICIDVAVLFFDLLLDLCLEGSDLLLGDDSPVDDFDEVVEDEDDCEGETQGDADGFQPVPQAVGGRERGD